MRPVEGVKLSGDTARLAEELILDGQQRLTSLTQVLKINEAVATRDAQKQDLKIHSYFDIERALQGPDSLAESIIAVDEHRTLRSNFGRDIDLDLSTIAKEIAAFEFPCARVLDSSAWEEALTEVSTERLKRFFFRKQVLTPFREYQLPVITLSRETSKAAVCLVFERVSTGGFSLDVFELITATWAAEGLIHRDDWHGKSRSQGGRHAQLTARSLIRDLQATDFLQALSLLHSSARRGRDLAKGISSKQQLLSVPSGSTSSTCPWLPTELRPTASPEDSNFPFNFSAQKAFTIPIFCPTKLSSFPLRPS